MGFISSELRSQTRIFSGEPNGRPAVYPRVRSAFSSSRLRHYVHSVPSFPASFYLDAAAIANAGFLVADALPDAVLHGPPKGILAAFDAADALIEMLIANTVAVPVDLIMSTTLRSLRAVGDVFTGVLRCYESLSDIAKSPGVKQNSVHYGRTDSSSSTGPASISTNLSGNGCVLPSSSTLETLSVLLRSLLSSAIPALLVHNNAVAKQATKKKTRLSHARVAHIHTSACTVAIDNILGSVYEHVLLPTIRAFAMLSEAYLIDCLRLNSGSVREGPAFDDIPDSLPDLRPDIFTLLGEVLTVLKDSLSQPRIETPRKTPATDSSASTSPSAGPFAANPTSGDVETLLALECIRELGKLYFPVSTSDHPETPNCMQQSSGSSTDVNPVPYPATPNAPAALATTLLSASDSATTSASIPAPRCASASAPSAPSRQPERARPGTCASARRPPTVTLLEADSGPPRSARNFGETYAGERASGRGPLSSHTPDHSVRPLRSGGDNASAIPPAHGQAAFARGSASGLRDGLSRNARIAELARKDAVWWLCAVLDRMLPPVPSVSPPGDQQAPGSASSTASASEASGSAAPAPTSTASGARSCSDIANEAVYDALADLLRRTRPRMDLRNALDTGLGTLGVNGGCAPSSPPSPRELSPRASTHAQADLAAVAVADHTVLDADESMELGLEGKHQESLESEKEVGKAGTREEDLRAGRPVGTSGGTGAEMSEVERGMLLAVLERAWLGV
ncbi:hypothetical protein BN946_scf185001.g42 [Trametes cinnabarina]|uniref:Uncharacterized protein n=1 Tax=Pycnoporus cinnabarinus TaxID=5643 RepID=A0A060SRJ0_PYCCI|nr:hypothetical protein BN946_scf185001.g42 [Trametes cinnabarina]